MCKGIIKNNENVVLCYFKLDSQKMDQHTRGVWLIHGTKRHDDNHL